MSDSNNTPQAPLRFALEFTQQIDNYLKEKKNATVQGFADRLRTTPETLWAWANKKRKDENGNLTDQLARPNFFAAMKRLEEYEKSQKENPDLLNAKQELFCQLYATNSEYFANGVQAYIEAYGIDVNKKGAYGAARANSSQLLTKTNILKRIDELLEVNGLNDQAVDKELAFVIIQKADLSSKVAAIREYNKLRQRITEKIDHTTKGKALPTPIYGGKSTS